MHPKHVLEGPDIPSVGVGTASGTAIQTVSRPIKWTRAGLQVLSVLGFTDSRRPSTFDTPL